jgi:hypothetical protein
MWPQDGREIGNWPVDTIDIGPRRYAELAPCFKQKLDMLFWVFGTRGLVLVAATVCGVLKFPCL